VDVACRAYYQQQYNTSASLDNRHSYRNSLGMINTIDDDDFCDDDDDDDDHQDDYDTDYDNDDVKLKEGESFSSIRGRHGITIANDGDDDDDDDDRGVSPKEVQNKLYLLTVRYVINTVLVILII